MAAKPKRGIILLEFVLGVGLLVLTAGAVFPLVRQCMAAYRGYAGDIEMQEQARIVMDRMGSELRYARNIRVVNDKKIVFVSEQASGTQLLKRGYWLENGSIYMILDDNTLQPLTGSSAEQRGKIEVRLPKDGIFVKKKENGMIELNGTFVNTYTKRQLDIKVTVLPLMEEYGTT